MLGYCLDASSSARSRFNLEGYTLGCGGIDACGSESAVPVEVFGNHTWASISPGVAYMCGVDTNGTALCCALPDDGLG